MRHQPTLTDGMVAEEGSVPGALGVFLPGAFAAAADVAGTPEPVATDGAHPEKRNASCLPILRDLIKAPSTHADLPGDDA